MGYEDEDWYCIESIKNDSIIFLNTFIRLHATSLKENTCFFQRAKRYIATDV